MQKIPAVPRSGNTSQSPWKVPALPAGTRLSPFTSRKQGTRWGRGSGLCRVACSSTLSIWNSPFPQPAWQGHLPLLESELPPWDLGEPGPPHWVWLCCSTTREQKSCSPLTRRTGTWQESRPLACLHCCTPAITSPSTARAVMVSHRCSEDPKEHNGMEKVGPYPKPLHSGTTRCRELAPVP